MHGYFDKELSECESCVAVGGTGEFSKCEGLLLGCRLSFWSSALICCDVLLVPSWEITADVSSSWYEENADVSEDDESFVVPVMN